MWCLFHQQFCQPQRKIHLDHWLVCVKIKIPTSIIIFIAYIYNYNSTYQVTLTANPTCETKHQIGMALKFLECAHFIKDIFSALSCILVEHNLYIHHHTTAYIVVANLASWERGYANCNSTYPVKASTLSGMRLAASKTAVRSWISK